MPVEDAVYEAAKVAAAKRGMLFRKWVQEAISLACDIPTTDTARPGRETQYVPFEEA